MPKLSEDSKVIIFGLITIAIMFIFMFFGTSTPNANEISIIEISEARDFVIEQCKSV